MKTDFLIIGSGIAGLSLALNLAPLGSVTVLTKKGITSGSTGLAQGGIAGVRNPEKDSSEKHFQDTLKAGAYHNDEDAVRLLVEKGEQALRDLERWGVKFDFSLHQEGGHTYARIFHVADETGRVVQEILSDAITEYESIEVIEDAFVVDLLMYGGYVAGCSFHHNGKNEVCLAKRTILSTGGAGQIYEKSTNPSVATGDGIAMAFRAGAELEDLEFIQFHPTALDMQRDPLFLLSEALRGAGAKITDEDGEHFVNELDARDIVAREIFLRIKSGKKVFLDFRHEKETFLKKRFPMIFENLLSFGLNLSSDLIPIVPAAHFFCGGVKTDISGRTSLPHLYAVGEVACTGVHGANRLASNSLLEGVVFAHQISSDIRRSHDEIVKTRFPEETNLDPKLFIPETRADAAKRKAIQHLMLINTGVVRRRNEMGSALKSLSAIKPAGTETQNILLVAKKVVEYAMKRKESLGCHFIVDQ